MLFGTGGEATRGGSAHCHDAGIRDVTHGFELAALTAIIGGIGAGSVERIRACINVRWPVGRSIGRQHALGSSSGGTRALVSGGCGGSRRPGSAHPSRSIPCWPGPSARPRLALRGGSVATLGSSGSTCFPATGASVSSARGRPYRVCMGGASGLGTACIDGASGRPLTRPGIRDRRVDGRRGHAASCRVTKSARTQLEPSSSRQLVPPARRPGSWGETQKNRPTPEETDRLSFARVGYSLPGMGVKYVRTGCRHLG